MWKLQPPWKKSPPLSQQLPSKSWGPAKLPPFLKKGTHYACSYIFLNLLQFVYQFHYLKGKNF